MRNFLGKKYSITSIFFASIIITTSIIAVSCSSKKDLMVKPLFRQAHRVNVELPDEGWVVDSITGAVIASEIVRFSNEDEGKYYNMDSVITKPVTGASSEVDITQGVHRLRSVEVKAKYRFAPEREGYINTDFMLRVPKELLSTNWRVVVSPVLLHNDSLVPMKKVILRGAKFAEKQKESYAEYRKFLETLVSKPEYDKYFLDRKNLERDVKRQQTHYFDQYYYAWSKRVNFEKWKFEREDQDAFYYAKRMGFNFKKYNEYALKTLLETDPDKRENKISLGLSDEYRKKYEKVTEGFPSLWKQEEMTEKVVPRRYRQTFRDDIAAKDITNKYVSEADIKKISENRYFFDAIALNEASIHRRGDIFKAMVRYPYEAPDALFLDSIVEGTEDFELYYRHFYRVTEGLKNVRVTVNSQIQAIDRSTYRTAKADTITYVVSSLAQLMDTTLIGKKNIISRTVTDSTAMYFEYQNNDGSFDIKYLVNRGEMSKFIEIYERSKKNGYIIDNIALTSYASLDGMAATNERLSGRRLAEVKKHILSVSSELGDKLTTRNVGEDVNMALTLIEASDLIQNKDAIISKLKNAKNIDAAEAEIRYGYKDDYRNLREHIYPRLRRIEAVFNMRRYNAEQYDDAVKQAAVNYKRGLKLLEERKYTEALAVLEPFTDYNTAVALVCLGHNSRAYDLLRKLEDNSNNNYLKAIVAQRMKNDKRAVEYLIKACEEDYTKVYRTNLDSETKQLVIKYNLQPKLDAIVEQHIQKQIDGEQKSEEATSDELTSDLGEQEVSEAIVG